MTWTGGCLCGSVRYEAHAPPIYASYCHCAMCRKSSGAPFTGFVQFADGTLHWTAGEAREYHSSPGVTRRFCGQCGSNLTFEAEGIAFVTLGSLDTPELVDVKCHTYTASRLPGMEAADGLPHFQGPAGGKGGRPIE